MLEEHVLDRMNVLVMLDLLMLTVRPLFVMVLKLHQQQYAVEEECVQDQILVFVTLVLQEQIVKYPFVLVNLPPIPQFVPILEVIVRVKILAAATQIILEQNVS